MNGQNVTPIDRAARLFSELLWVWVPLAIAAGLVMPGLDRLEPFTLLFLAFIVGGVALSLDLRGFGGLKPSWVARMLASHVILIPIAWLIGHGLGLAPIHIAGLVLLGASTPDLTAPLLSRIARGDTHATMFLLVAAGLLSVILIPLSVYLLIDPTLRVPLRDLLTVLFVGLLLPMFLGIALQAAAPRAVARAEHYGSAASTLATILVTALIAAVNRPLLLDTFSSLPLARLTLAAGALFAAGMTIGHLAGRGTTKLRRGGLFVPGTREYALAAALVVAAGFPPSAALVPLIFGAIQMVLAPLLAHAFSRQRSEAPPTG